MKQIMCCAHERAAAVAAHCSARACQSLLQVDVGPCMLATGCVHFDQHSTHHLQVFTELEIPHIYHSVARNSPKRQELIDKWGVFQVPYIEVSPCLVSCTVVRPGLAICSCLTAAC